MSTRRLWFATIAFIVLQGGAALGCAQAPRGERVPQPAKAEQLIALANESRAQANEPSLQWDPGLAEAAMRHCMLMAAAGPIEHRYQGELDLTERTAQAGAHFSLIEENIAVGAYPASIHQGWLDSPGHRANLLNPEINRIGVAVVAAQGVLYAVADYARGVPVLTPQEVEAKVGSLLRGNGVTPLRDPADARAACVMDRGLPALRGADHPQFVMRWQDADLGQLPSDLQNRLATGRYRYAEVGSCPARSAEAGFTVYRVAVLLY
jgi:hypothetical protein